MAPLSVVILTYNEQLHIRRAVENVYGWATEVFVVDSGSTDDTRNIAAKAGARVVDHPFEDYAKQREWALRNLPYAGEWMLFLDADEIVSPELKAELDELLPRTDPTIHGMLLKRRFYWMNRWIRHGGMYPTWILRVVRHAGAEMDGRAINEHLRVHGGVVKCRHDLLHSELHGIATWVEKHSRYAALEAVELLRSDDGAVDDYARFWGSQPQRKRWILKHVWQRFLPSASRPFVLFFYQYIMRLGFLDGAAGLSYFGLKSLYYRFLVESNYRALRQYGSMACNPESLHAAAPSDGEEQD